MKHSSKEMLKTIISNQQLIMKALKIEVVEKKAESKDSKKVAIKKAPAKKAAVKKTHVK